MFESLFVQKMILCSKSNCSTKHLWSNPHIKSPVLQTQKRGAHKSYYIFGQVRRLMFEGVNFLVKFKYFGHIHSVILNRSSEYSS